MIRLLLAALAAVFLFTHTAHAMDPIPGQSPREKAREQWKQKRDKETDDKYRETMKQIPDAPKKPADPWAGVRGRGEGGK